MLHFNVQVVFDVISNLEAKLCSQVFRVIVNSNTYFFNFFWVFKHILQLLFVELLEPVVRSQVFLRMFCKIKEACWILIKIDISEEIQQITCLLLDVFHELWAVPMSILVHSSRSGLVKLISFFSHIDRLLYSLLYDCAFNRFKPQHECESLIQHLLRVHQNILKSEEMQRHLHFCGFL